MANNLVQLKYEWSQSTITLFLLSFWLTIFILLSQHCNIFRQEVKRSFALLLSNWFSHGSFAFIIRCFPNASRYSARMEILLYKVSICPRSQQLKFNSSRHPWSLTNLRESVHMQYTVMFVYILFCYLTHVKCHLDTSQGTEFKNQ